MGSVEEKASRWHNQIEDYGLIGDMRTCALVGKDGSIDFMCWPKFDSPSLFARVLDTTKKGGGHWSIHPTVTVVTKQRYLASSNMIQTRWICEEGLVTLTDFFAVRRESKELVKKQRGPVLIRRLDCMRGTMDIKIEVAPRPNYADGTPRIIGMSRGNGHSQQINWSKPPEHHLDITIAPEETPLAQLSAMYLPEDGEVHETTTKLFNPINLSSDGKPDAVSGTFRLHEGQSIILVLSNAGDTDLETLKETTERRYTECQKYWRNWISKCRYRGRFQQEVERSLLALKLLTYKPTGAIVAAPTFSLPESIGGGRNWDYRYSWVRDSSFTVYVFLKMGFAEEAEAYMNFIFSRLHEWQDSCKDGGETPHLPLMFSIDGETKLPELELPHLGGYKDSRPVRIGNGATTHVQLDIYGELMDAVYLYQKHGKPISYEQWVIIRHLTDFVCTVWQEPDMSIWEVRGKKEHFVYSKIMLWVAVDRALRLAEKRSNLPCPNRQHWQTTRDAIYESVMTNGYDPKLKTFVQSYGNTTLDAAVLVAPLVFFVPPNDPRFLTTLSRILQPPHKGGLTDAGLVYRYNHELVNDGVGGREGAFIMCTLWLVEALVRAAAYENPTAKLNNVGKIGFLEQAEQMFENVCEFSNDLGLFSEEIAISGEALGNTPQAFSHLAFVSAAMNLERVRREGKIED